MKTKNTFLTLPVLTAASALLCLAPAQATVLVAYWNFNDFSTDGEGITVAAAPGTANVPTSIAADEGSSTISLEGWTGLIDDFAGSTLNAPEGTASGGSLSLVSQAGNASFITISIPVAGLEGYSDLEVSFDTRGTGTGFNESFWSWSTDDAIYTDLADSNTATRSTTFATASLTFADVLTGLAGSETLYLRYTLAGATTDTGNNRIDNLQIVAVPELSSALLAMLGSLGLLRRRR